MAEQKQTSYLTSLEVPVIAARITTRVYGQGYGFRGQTVTIYVPVVYLDGKSVPLNGMSFNTKQEAIDAGRTYLADQKRSDET